jgi:Ca2+-binding EF-hand superfamily protein
MDGMRKLMAVALATGILTGCNAQTMTAVAPRQAAAPTVRSLSDTGIKQAIRHAVNSTFQNADWNHDGMLAPNESHNLDADAFAKADKNKDYKLSLSEFLAYSKAQEPQMLQYLRQSAQMGFQYSDTNKDNFVTFDEFYAILNPVPVPVPPYPDPSSVPTGNFGPYRVKANVTPGYPSNDPGYGSAYGGYDPGYGSGYGGYEPSPYYPSYPTVTRQHAALMFNLSDHNKDRKLNLSEFEDLNAWMQASSVEPSGPVINPTAYPSTYPTPYPSAVPVPPIPVPTAIPSTPDTRK